MACKTCNKILTYPIYYEKTTSYCNTTREEVLAIKDKLKCLKTKIKFKDYVVVMSVINIMLRMNDYCRYDYEYFKKLIDENDC